MQVNMHEAKTQLSKLVEAAQNGEEIIIAKNGVPAVRLMRVPDRPRKRILGQGKGLVKMSEDSSGWSRMTRAFPGA